jgi:hypothetical protein
VIFIDPLKGDAMNKIALLSTSLVVMLFALLPIAPTQAAPLTWVASYGSDTNNTTCSRTSPCLTFQQAHDQTDPNGQVNCIDAGSGTVSSQVTVTKSITIDCPAGLLLGVNTLAVQISAPGAVVRLRNLSFNGLHYGNVGIDFVSGAALIVENCAIANYNNFDAIGIRFRPSAPAQLVVTNTSVDANGFQQSGGGIVIKPQPGGTAQVTLNGVSVAKNVFGIAVDGSNSTGGINMTINDSVSSSNLNDGIIATTPSGGAPIGVYVKNTRLANNGFGIRSIGPNVTVRVDGSGIIGNSTGLTFSGGGKLLSAGNNFVEANAVNGAFSGAVTLK